MNKPRKTLQADHLKWMKEAGYTTTDMDQFWQENYGTNHVVTNLTDRGYTWRDMNLCVVQKLPTQKERDAEILRQKREAEIAAEEIARKKAVAKKYYQDHFDEFYNQFEEIMINKIETKENLTEEELRTLVYEYDECTEYGDDHRWTREAFTVVKLCDRYFGIDWMKALTERGEDEFDSQPFEVKQVEKVVVTKEWVALDDIESTQSQLTMFDELKAWAEKWNIKHKLSDPTEKWPYQSISFDCCDYQEPTFQYNPTDSSNFWQGGE